MFGFLDSVWIPI